MYAYPLNSRSPNQNFSTVVDGFTFDITLNTACDLLFATVKIDDKVVKTSGRCIEGQWMVPYSAYLPDGCGNFKFFTRDERYPAYDDFNVSCVLVYYSADEIKEAEESGT